MAQKTKEQLKEYWNLNINSNGVQAITGSKMNTGGIDIIDSMALEGSSPLTFNVDEGVYEFDTDVAGVTNQISLEDFTRVVNNTGATIPNGTAVYFSGVDSNDTSEVSVAYNTSESIANRTVGLTTNAMVDGAVGFVTSRGIVRGLDTSSFTFAGPLYLGVAGELTQVKPVFPSTALVMGGLHKQSATVGEVRIAITRDPVVVNTKSYNFTSNGLLSGEYFLAGYYQSIPTAAAITLVSNIDLGSFDVSYAAHVFAVSSGNGSVTGTGTVALQVTGTRIEDDGTKSDNYVDIIIPDITNSSLNEYHEGVKFVGHVVYDLVITSGAPSAASLSFNYGFAKYDDFGNRDFVLSDFENVGIGGGTDTAFDIILYHHSDQGWTYAPIGFESGGDLITSLRNVQGDDSDVKSGEYFAFKRTGLNETILGASQEGIVIKVVTTSNSTVQYMDSHVTSVLI